MNLLKKLFLKARLEERIFFLCLIFLPTQLGKHFWPEFSYIHSLKIDYLSPTFYFWNFLVVVLFLIWSFKRPKINGKALLILLLFFLTQALSLFNANNLGGGLVRMEQFLVAGFFGLYISSHKLEDIKSALRQGFLIALFMESSIAIAQFILNRSVELWILGERSFSISTPSIANFNWYGQIFLRPYATFPHPNVLGAFIVIVIPLLLLFSKNKQTQTDKIFLNLTIILGAFSAILSFSRSALVILIGQLLFFLRQRLVLAAILLIIISPWVITRFGSALNFDNLSIIRREELAAVAIRQFTSFPIFGNGLNNFLSQSAQDNLISGPSRFLQPVHNIFLLTLAETGIIGFVGLLVLVGFPILRLVKLKSRVSRTLLFAWFSIIFLGLFDHYFLTLPQGQRLLFLVWGLSMLQ
ncbi:O-antigen ligase family protein [Candidatus Daviesbacteria bacterium]|nr:O-antigen ligase family protein [Candidatus Daviesbacteria bacterium]